MIITLYLTDSKAEEILKKLGVEYTYGTQTAFRTVAHNQVKEYEKSVLLVKVAEAYFPAKDWIEVALNDALIDMIKQGLNTLKQE